MTVPRYFLRRGVDFVVRLIAAVGAPFFGRVARTGAGSRCLSIMGFSSHACPLLLACPKSEGFDKAQSMGSPFRFSGH